VLYPYVERVYLIIDVVCAETVNIITFKGRLDRLWSDQDVL